MAWQLPPSYAGGRRACGPRDTATAIPLGAWVNEQRIVLVVNPRMRQRLLDDLDGFPAIPMQEFQVHLVVGNDLVFLLPAADLRQSFRAICADAEIDVADIQSIKPFLARHIDGLADAPERMVSCRW